MELRQVRRNQACPCGSGKRFKHCHGAFQSEATTKQEHDAFVRQKCREHEAREWQRRKQQGLGRPIVSFLSGETRFVAVFDTLFWSKTWKTFHDFLREYPNHIFGADWLRSETIKRRTERHPFAELRIRAWEDAKRLAEKRGTIFSIPQTAATTAFLQLSYNLYLTAHNVRLQNWLVRRLKNRAQYWGAVYETYVTAAFIRAGFEIKFEDEADCGKSHCEFTATYPKSQKRFSVEAKSRNRSDQTRAQASASLREHLSVGRQLKKALKKKADHPRVVFIEVGAPEMDSEAIAQHIVAESIQDLRERESSLLIDRGPAPPAYVFVTNYPYYQHLDLPLAASMILATGFKIPDFGPDEPFTDAHAYIRAKERHLEMHALLASLREHQEIPATFDGDNPDQAYAEEENPRLLIGSEYLIPDSEGHERSAILDDACVLEPERRAYCIYRTVDGKRWIYVQDLSESELAAYRRHPETFFGIKQQTPRKITTLSQAFEMLYNVYRGTPKQKLLQWMASAPDIAELALKDQPELAIIYCERTAYGIINPTSAKENAA
jgi:hypothetical protein